MYSYWSSGNARYIPNMRAPGANNCSHRPGWNEQCHGFGRGSGRIWANLYYNFRSFFNKFADKNTISRVARRHIVLIEAWKHLDLLRIESRIQALLWHQLHISLNFGKISPKLLINIKKTNFILSQFFGDSLFRFRNFFQFAWYWNCAVQIVGWDIMHRTDRNLSASFFLKILNCVRLNVKRRAIAYLN